MKKLITTILIVSFYAAGYAQQITRSIDSIFNKKDYFNGGILVADHGRVIYHRSFGYADLLTDKRLDINMSFQTASVSKVFTSTAVLQLVNSGRIKLTDRVKKYIPDFTYADITVANLLTHTSGLPDADIFDSLLVKNPEKVIRNSDLIKALNTVHKPLHFVPGSRFEYCNIGYQLLALLVEKVSNSRFADYLSANIFKPTGMKRSFLTTQGQEPDVKNHTTWPMYAIQPRNVNDVAVQSDQLFQKRLYYDVHTMGATYGDQNVITTTGDMFLFTKALLGGKLISKELLKQVISPQLLNDGKAYSENNAALGGAGSSFGLGWEIRVVGNTVVMGHSGYNRGIYVQYYVDVTNDRMVIMFDNTEGMAFLQKFLNITALLNGQLPKSIDMRRSAVRLFGNDLISKTSTAALIHFNAMKRDTASYRFTPQQMNQLGYDFLQHGFTDNALEVFKINVLLYPADFNRYDSYGDVLVKAGKLKEAVLMYEEALMLNPDSKNTKLKLDKLL